MTQPLLLLRLKWTALTLVALVGIAIAGILAAFAFTFVTALIFLGSTGRTFANFIDQFAPIGYFGEGAFVCGGIVALLNAIISPRPFWFKSIAAISFVGGLVVAVTPTLGHRLTVFADPVYAVFRNLNDESRSFESEQALAAAFVKNQRAVALAVGENFETGIVQTTTSHGTPVQYDIAVSADRKAYAIVKVSRSSGKVEFTLACVTPLYFGQRDSSDPCK